MEKKDRETIHLEECDIKFLNKLLEEEYQYFNGKLSPLINVALRDGLKMKEETLLKCLKGGSKEKKLKNKEPHTITIDREIKESLNKLSHKSNVSKSTIITTILKHWVAAHKKLAEDARKMLEEPKPEPSLNDMFVHDSVSNTYKSK